MSLISQMKQSTEPQEESNINIEAESQQSQGGLTVRTDLRAGMGEDIKQQIGEGLQNLMDRLSSLKHG